MPAAVPEVRPLHVCSRRLLYPVDSNYGRVFLAVLTSCKLHVHFRNVTAIIRIGSPVESRSNPTLKLWSKPWRTLPYSAD
jgi:hypothetical protein